MKPLLASSFFPASSSLLQSHFSVCCTAPKGQHPQKQTMSPVTRLKLKGIAKKAPGSLQNESHLHAEESVIFATSWTNHITFLSYKSNKLYQVQFSKFVTRQISQKTVWCWSTSHKNTLFRQQMHIIYLFHVKS